MKFYIGEDLTSSSITSDKITGNIRSNVFETVRSIDILSFLEKFSEAKVLFLKMDVEGAEYPIVARMLATGAFCSGAQSKYVAIEYHAKKKASPKEYRAVEQHFPEVIETILKHQCGVEFTHFNRNQ